MAGRPPKKGLDYAGWSVTIFDNDTKIDKLLDAHGWDGFGIYFYLCQRIYGGEGYFYRWGYDDCASTARKMGGGIGSGTVKETVDYCLRIGLFDKGLFDRWEVLTSRGIQKRYCRAIKDRDFKEVISEYWLLHESEECKGLLKLPLNADFSEVNANYPAGNEDFQTINANSQTQKKSKVNKSKEEYSSAFERLWKLYPRKKEKLKAYACYNARLKEGVSESDLLLAVERYADDCRILATEECFIKHGSTFLGTSRPYEDYLAEDFKPAQKPIQKQAGNKFHNFQQRDYDFAELEKQLINR